MLSTTCGEKKKNDPHSLLRCRKLESWSKLFLLQVRPLFAHFFFLYFRSSHLRTTSNKLLVSLSVADFLILSMCQLVNVQNLVSLGPIFGTFGCKIYGTISSMAALAEIWTLTIVSVDRAQAIFHPIETKKRMRSGQVKAIKMNSNSNVKCKIVFRFIFGLPSFGSLHLLSPFSHSWDGTNTARK